MLKYINNICCTHHQNAFNVTKKCASKSTSLFFKQGIDVEHMLGHKFLHVSFFSKTSWRIPLLFCIMQPTKKEQEMETKNSININIYGLRDIHCTLIYTCPTPLLESFSLRFSTIDVSFSQVIPKTFLQLNWSLYLWIRDSPWL